MIVERCTELVTSGLRNIRDLERQYEITWSVPLPEARKPGVLLVLPWEMEEERVQEDIQIAVTKLHAFDYLCQYLLPPGPSSRTTLLPVHIQCLK